MRVDAACNARSVEKYDGVSAVDGRYRRDSSRMPWRMRLLRWSRAGAGAFALSHLSARQPVCQGDGHACRRGIGSSLEATWWAVGAWWRPDYFFTVQPGKNGSDKPQIRILSKYARRAENTWRALIRSAWMADSAPGCTGVHATPSVGRVRLAASIVAVSRSHAHAAGDPIRGKQQRTCASPSCHHGETASSPYGWIVAIVPSARCSSGAILMLRRWVWPPDTTAS